jgi:DNA-directed RNA polymerase specialized sigma24 family protein
MSIEEIAGVLGMGSSAAKHSIFRAVRKMRRALAPMVSLAE